MKVKICGLSRPEDIEAVNAAKPDYCGFIVNFPKSRRNVSPDTLRALRAGLDGSVTPVGVFVDQPVEDIAALLADGSIAVAQLHGQEDEAYIASLRTRTGRPIWQAFQIRSMEDVERANQSTADLILLDAGQGAGRTFNWTLLAGVTRPFALAGGLHTENIPLAMRTNAVLLDVSSGAETDGKKDFQKIQTIVKMIQGE